MPPKAESPDGEPPVELESVAAPAPAGDAETAAAATAEAESPQEIPAAPPRPRTPQRPTGPITIPPKLRPVMPKHRSAVRPIYMLVIGVIIGLVGAVFYFRAEIARAVPAFDMVYSLMGISTTNPAKDLEIGNLVFDRRISDGQTVISVQGDIFNSSEFPVRLPYLVAIPLGKDGDGKSIALTPEHRFRLEQEIVEPGETVTFRTLFTDPPKGAKSLLVDFLK